MDTITFEEFKKTEIRIGKIIECEKIPDADKLLKLQVDFGPSTSLGTTSAEGREIRQIVSGIATSYTSEELVGKSLPFVVNLEYRKLRGEESQGMLMAVGVGDKVILLEPNGEVPPGTEVV
jgi:methionine--tRNA ligase beta chain